MSTDPKQPGGKMAAEEMVADAKALFEHAQAQEEQLELLEPVTPEEMIEAREMLGPNAGRLAVLRHAREERKRGRPKGAKNKRTDDFARYLLQFGQHPAITMMQIQATPPEVLIEASQQAKVHSFQKNGKPNIVTERMTYEAAQALRVRCAEGLMPFLESKKPVAVDATVRGVMVVEEIGKIERAVGAVIDGDVLGIGPVGDDT